MKKDMNVNIGFQGFYHITKTNLTTGKVEEYEFENLILDSGLDRYAQGYVSGGMLVGSSTAEPHAAQSTMSDAIGATTTQQSAGNAGQNLATLPYWVSCQWTYRFAEGVATGNISQVGFGWGVNANNQTYQGLFSLARIKDSNGNPITITKLADEVLDIRYTLRQIIPDDTTGTINIGGQNYNFIMRPANIGSWNPSYYLTAKNSNPDYAYSGDIASVKNSPSGAYSAINLLVFDPYVQGTFTRTVKSLVELNNGNLDGGVRSVHLTFYGHRWQIQYNNVLDNSPIPKDGTKIMTLNFKFSWGRANVT